MLVSANRSLSDFLVEHASRVLFSAPEAGRHAVECGVFSARVAVPRPCGGALQPSMRTDLPNEMEMSGVRPG